MMINFYLFHFALQRYCFFFIYANKKEKILAILDRKIEELQRDAGARTYALSLH